MDERQEGGFVYGSKSMCTYDDADSTYHTSHSYSNSEPNALVFSPFALYSKSECVIQVMHECKFSPVRWSRTKTDAEHKNAQDRTPRPFGEPPNLESKANHKRSIEESNDLSWYPFPRL